MRPARLATISLLCAGLGAVTALAIARGVGWIGSSTTQTVVVPATSQPRAVSEQTILRSAGKPLPGNGFDPARLYRERASGVVTIYAFFGNERVATSASQGSGFVVSPQGYILTSSHVITNAGDTNSVRPAGHVYVQFADRDRVSAQVVGWDVFDDVGVLKIDPSEHHVAGVPLGDSSAVVVGEPVAAIGSPFGNADSLATGVVSAVHRSIDSLTSSFSVPDAIQTDAPINHGNSGGPLFDARGRVIGINAQIRSDSGSAEGVGFAVPIDSARRSMTQLIASGRVSYAYVGIETEDLIPSIAKQLGYPVSHGAVVTKVNPGTPGAEAGLQAGTVSRQLLGAPFISGGDVIVSIAGHPVGSAEDVVRVVTEQLFPGQSVPVTFFRAGRRHQVTLKLAQRPASPG